MGEYYDLYLKSDTSLLAGVSKNFRIMCLGIYELDPEKCYSAHRLAWQAALKKTKLDLELLTGIDILVMVEKVSQVEYVILFVNMWKLIIILWKITNKSKELSYVKYQDINSLYWWATSQKLPENDFNWVEEISQFNEDFITIYNEDSDIGYLIEADFQYSEELHGLTS